MCVGDLLSLFDGRLNMMEEEFCDRRMAEHKHAAYFAIHCEMDHEQDKEKREEERARKCKKACRAKGAFAHGGEQALIKDKWPHITLD
jgi:hypothetical protein